MKAKNVMGTTQTWVSKQVTEEKSHKEPVIMPMSGWRGGALMYQHSRSPMFKLCVLAYFQESILSCYINVVKFYFSFGALFVFNL